MVRIVMFWFFHPVRHTHGGGCITNQEVRMTSCEEEQSRSTGFGGSRITGGPLTGTDIAEGTGVAGTETDMCSRGGGREDVSSGNKVVVPGIPVSVVLERTEAVGSLNSSAYERAGGGIYGSKSGCGGGSDTSKAMEALWRRYEAIPSRVKARNSVESDVVPVSENQAPKDKMFCRTN